MNKKQFDTIIKKLNANGELTASGILEEAKKKTSPLHNLFEWDDSAAAHEYRLIQARKIIRSANVRIEDAGDKIVHVPVEKSEKKSGKEGKYKKVEVVVKNVSDFELALKEVFKRLNAAKRALDELQGAAAEERPEDAATIGIALEALMTANAAIAKIH